MERSAFLRTLNYVRVQHAYSLSFNLVYPAIGALLVVSIFVIVAPATVIFGKSGFISSLSQLLAILAPFYIASLAAVATFTGSPALDKDFQMAEPVALWRLERGEWMYRRLTLRQFLSLLFGYCSVISLILFFIAAAVPFLADPLGTFLKDYDELERASRLVGFFLFMYVFAQMIAATLLGLYYLADGIHRQR